jgi:hypothetical protein
MAALNGQRPDRMPIFNGFWPEFRAVWSREKGEAGSVNPVDYYGIDIRICTPDETPYPSRIREVRRDGRNVWRVDGYGRLIRSVTGAHFDEVLENPIKTHRDLDANPFDAVVDDDRYTGFLDRVEREREGRCCFCKVGGPYLRTTYIRGETAFLMDIASDPTFARELANRMGDFLTGIGLEALRRSGLQQNGIWIYDDIAYNHNPMFSPDAFERVFLPAYGKMVRAFKAAGASKVVLHSDGNIGPLLDMLVDAGFDGINPVEPRAGLDIVALKAQYGDRLALIGGMCNAFVLPSGSFEEIRGATRRILEAGADGGIVIGTHSIGDDVPVRNYECYHETVMTEGRYQ